MWWCDVSGVEMTNFVSLGQFIICCLNTRANVDSMISRPFLASLVPSSYLVEMVKEDESSAGAFPLGLVGLPLVHLQLKVICGSWVGHCYLLVSSLVWGQFRIVKQQPSGKMFTHTVHLNVMICTLHLIGTLHLNLSVVCGRVKCILCVLFQRKPYVSVKMLLHLMSPKSIKPKRMPAA